jgi:hypothetical protein
MNRTLVVASLGFVAAFGAERLFSGLAKDIARYDRMRAMSGEPPMLKELLSTVGGVLGNATRHNGATGFIADMTNDIVRYAKMKGM